MNDLQETVWSSSHLQHNGISWSFSVLHPSSQHMPFFSNPGHDLVVRPVIVKLNSRFGWRQTLWCYKRRQSDNFLLKVLYRLVAGSQFNSWLGIIA